MRSVCIFPHPWDTCTNPAPTLHTAGHCTSPHHYLFIIWMTARLDVKENFLPCWYHMHSGSRTREWPSEAPECSVAITWAASKRNIRIPTVQCVSRWSPIVQCGPPGCWWCVARAGVKAVGAGCRGLVTTHRPSPPTIHTSLHPGIADTSLKKLSGTETVTSKVNLTSVASFPSIHTWA